MGKFIFKDTPIEGVKVITPTMFGDERGYFMEAYNKKEFEAAGICEEFVQDNQSMSSRGVLRGLHFQNTFPQGKLVRVLSGEVFDVAVDIRKGSKTFGKWFGMILRSSENNMLYIPRGFAHGFLVLSEKAEFIYKCNDFYHPEDEGGILWNDSTIGIEWPLDGIDKVILSDKDKRHNDFSEFIKVL